jgi:hypothetical protein
MSYHPPGSHVVQPTPEERIVVISRVGPFSCAKVVGLLYVVLGLVFGGVISMFALASGMAAAGEPGPVNFLPGVFGLAAVVVLPILYGCLGFVMTLIMASLYNVVASVIGGIEVDLR